MNKIIVQFGMLCFFISIIIFSQQQLTLQDILIRSFVVFVVLTIMMTILVLVFIRFINKTSFDKQKNINENFAGNRDNE